MVYGQEDSVTLFFIGNLVPIFFKLCCNNTWIKNVEFEKLYDMLKTRH